MEKDQGQQKMHNELDIMVRPSSFFLFFNISIIHLIIAIGIVLVLFVPGLFYRSGTSVEMLANFKIFSILLLVIVGEIVTMIVLARWVTEFYIIKNESLTYRMGILLKEKRVLLMRQIVEVIMMQNFMGYVFNYGTIKIITPQSMEGIFISRIENPNKYFRILRELSLKQQSIKPDEKKIEAATAEQA